MKRSNIGFISTCILLLIGGVGIIAAINSGWFHDDHSIHSFNEGQARPTTASTAPQPKRATIPKVGWRKMGGILRPPSDFTKPSPESDIIQQQGPLADVGQSPLLPADMNANTQSVMEAVKTKKFPERLSVLIEPPPFDKQQFSANPQPYLDKVEPGRVFQVKAKGPKAKPIRESGEQYFELIQGESAILNVTTDPNMPVTFYSSRLGQFENGLTSQTIQADETGVATAKFLAASGTYGVIDVLAGSPTRSGNARFVVKVSAPKSTVAQSTH